MGELSERMYEVRASGSGQVLDHIYDGSAGSVEEAIKLVSEYTGRPVNELEAEELDK